MAKNTATVPEPKAKGKKGAAEAEAPATKTKAEKTVAVFTVADVSAASKEFSGEATRVLEGFKNMVSGWLAKCEADPRAYRDHVTAVKFADRRIERISLSLSELAAGLKERTPRPPKAEKTEEAAPAEEEAPAKTKGKKAKAAEAKVEADDEDDLDD